MSIEFTEEHASRLLTLASFLRDCIDPDQFDMSNYVCSELIKEVAATPLDDLEDSGKALDAAGELAAEEIVNGETRCGTAACAAGWCPYVFPDDWEYSSEIVPVLKSGSIAEFADRFDDLMEEKLYPGLKVTPTIACLSLFFGLDLNEVDNLFYSDFDRTNADEADTIEQLVEEKGYVYAE